MAPFAHTLVLPLPFQGHINPMLHLLRRLCSSSPCSLFTVLLPERDVARTEASIPDKSRIRVVGIPGQVLDMDRLESLHSVRQLMVVLDGLEQAKDGILELVRCTGAGIWQDAVLTCLLSDQFISMAQDLANELNIPRIAIWAPSAATLLVHSYLPKLMSEGVIPSKEMDDLPISLPGLPGLRRKNLPQSLLDASHGELVFRSRIMSRTKDAACVLGNTIYELELQVMKEIDSALGTRFVPVGPLFPLDVEQGQQQGLVSPGGRGAMWEEDIHCLDWLDTQAPQSVLYISFGSMATLSKAQVEEMSRGLVMSKQAFLWAVRPTLVNDDKFSSNDFVRSFVAKTAGQGMVISWAPQLSVLRHKAVGGFLTHCGWNSILEAILSGGVPMLGWPCFAEQNLNCKSIVDDWKVGLRFNKSKDGLVHAEEIKRVVKLLMVAEEGQLMRKKCQVLAERVVKKVKEDGESRLQGLIPTPTMSGHDMPYKPSV